MLRSKRFLYTSLGYSPLRDEKCDIIWYRAEFMRSTIRFVCFFAGLSALLLSGLAYLPLTAFTHGCDGRRTAFRVYVAEIVV